PFRRWQEALHRLVRDEVRSNFHCLQFKLPADQFAQKQTGTEEVSLRLWLSQRLIKTDEAFVTAFEHVPSNLSAEGGSASRVRGLLSKVKGSHTALNVCHFSQGFPGGKNFADNTRGRGIGVGQILVASIGKPRRELCFAGALRKLLGLCNPVTFGKCDDRY